MKDEEMAEEYKKQFYGVRSLFSFSDIGQAFLAGLKADRPQWHDLRKDPDDLLPFNVKVNVYHKWGKVEIGKREKCSTARNGWLWSMCSDRFRYTSDDKNVLAWCEIPTFDKE